MPKVSFSLHCESSSLPNHCLEDLVELHTCLGYDSWKASGIASDTVALSTRTFSLRRGSDYMAKRCLGGPLQFHSSLDFDSWDASGV